MTVTAEDKLQIKQKGYADIGGLQKNHYWTPDGREVVAVPAMRTYNVIENGKVIESGVRDANLDNGWFLQKPAILKPHCPHCDRWHDTQKEIDKCGVNKIAFNKKWDKLAQKMKADEGGEVNSLKTEVDGLKEDVSQIKDMLLQLLKEK